MTTLVVDQKDAEGASTCPAKSPPRTVTGVGKKRHIKKNT